MTIQELQKLRWSITELRKLEAHIQDNCPHEGLVGEYKGNSGNWDRNDDSYWIEFDCPVCNRHWNEDQSDASYKIVDGKYEHVSKEGFVFNKKTKYDRD